MVQWVVGGETFWIWADMSEAYVAYNSCPRHRPNRGKEREKEIKQRITANNLNDGFGILFLV